MKQYEWNLSEYVLICRFNKEFFIISALFFHIAAIYIKTANYFFNFLEIICFKIYTICRFW